mmetsp:Transcript_51948/g.111093  ORF Transcript_51948/g.111093 Transcript_51948/m.111093 type:complete len:422 (+) Transcript_51948:1480-2745(+)
MSVRHDADVGGALLPTRHDLVMDTRQALEAVSVDAWIQRPQVHVGHRSAKLPVIRNLHQRDASRHLLGVPQHGLRCHDGQRRQAAHIAAADITAAHSRQGGADIHEVGQQAAFTVDLHRIHVQGVALRLEEHICDELLQGRAIRRTCEVVAMAALIGLRGGEHTHGRLLLSVIIPHLPLVVDHLRVLPHIHTGDALSPRRASRGLVEGEATTDRAEHASTGHPDKAVRAEHEVRPHTDAVPADLPLLLVPIWPAIHDSNGAQVHRGETRGCLLIDRDTGADQSYCEAHAVGVDAGHRATLLSSPRILAPVSLLPFLIVEANVDGDLSLSHLLLLHPGFDQHLVAGLQKPTLRWVHAPRLVIREREKLVVETGHALTKRTMPDVGFIPPPTLWLGIEDVGIVLPAECALHFDSEIWTSDGSQ